LKSYFPDEFPATVRIKDGLPEPNLDSQERILSQRHLQIDGCPATITQSVDAASLYVYVPGAHLLYELYTVSDAPHFEQFDKEAQEIFSSFHMDKVPLPSGGNKSGE